MISSLKNAAQDPSGREPGYRRTNKFVISNNLYNRVKKVLFELRKESFDKYTASLTVKNCSLWKAIKRVLRSHKPIPPLKKENSIWAITDYDKTVLFGTHLANVFQPHNDIPISPIFNNIDTILSTPLPMHLPPKHFSPGEVIQCIKSFPSQKSPGYDLITAEITGQLPKKAILMLTYILNAIIRLSYFPLQWKFSMIIFIHKSNTPQDLPSSYRPLSLLPFFSKVCEKFILNAYVRL